MYRAINAAVLLLKRIVPEPVVALLRTPYHFSVNFLAVLGAGFPARKLVVIGVTGIKGKRKRARKSS